MMGFPVMPAQAGIHVLVPVPVMTDVVAGRSLSSGQP